MREPQNSTSCEGEWHIRTFGECAELVRESVSLPGEEDVPYVGLEHIEKDTLSLLAHGAAGRAVAGAAGGGAQAGRGDCGESRMVGVWKWQMSINGIKRFEWKMARSGKML